MLPPQLRVDFEWKNADGCWPGNKLRIESIRTENGQTEGVIHIFMDAGNGYRDEFMGWKSSAVRKLERIIFYVDGRPYELHMGVDAASSLRPRIRQTLTEEDSGGCR